VSVEEASFEDTEYGRHVTSEGWFVLNLGDSLAVHNDEKGPAVYPLEPREAGFGEFGCNVRVLAPGQPACLYHAENQQEGFFVLVGECTLLVEEEERSLRQWDYFHCPAGTRHVIVGAGEGLSAVLMIGARRGDEEELLYPVSDVAAKYGASVAKETSNPEEAYADWPGEWKPTRLPWPPA
jgi:uncharacterized cupin superfamily protein